MDPLLIRPNTDADLGAVTAIYRQAVLHGTGTFELEPPGADEMARRRRDVLAQGLPWLAAERGGEVLGYAYANRFRPRAAYRWCLENSVYVHERAQGQGVGRMLLAELVGRCEALGARQMLALIGDADNRASIRLHVACGFEPCGSFKAAGWKLSRWLDVVLMQRALGPGAGSAPGEDAGP